MSVPIIRILAELPGENLTAYQYRRLTPGGLGEGLPCERGGDARRKIWIKPLKETNLGVAQALFDP